MPDSALNYYRAVLVIFPADKGALRSTAEVYEAIGRHNEAVEMRQFLVVLEENTESRQDLAQTLTLSERYQEALDVYLDILENLGRDIKARGFVQLSAGGATDP